MSLQPTINVTGSTKFCSNLWTNHCHLLEMNQDIQIDVFFQKYTLEWLTFVVQGVFHDQKLCNLL